MCFNRFISSLTRGPLPWNFNHQSSVRVHARILAYIRVRIHKDAHRSPRLGSSPLGNDKSDVSEEDFAKDSSLHDTHTGLLGPAMYSVRST